MLSKKQLKKQKQQKKAQQILDDILKEKKWQQEEDQHETERQVLADIEQGLGPQNVSRKEDWEQIKKKVLKYEQEEQLEEEKQEKLKILDELIQENKRIGDKVKKQVEDNKKAKEMLKDIKSVKYTPFQNQFSVFRFQKVYPDPDLESDDEFVYKDHPLLIEWKKNTFDPICKKQQQALYETKMIFQLKRYIFEKIEENVQEGEWNKFSYVQQVLDDAKDFENLYIYSKGESFIFTHKNITFKFKMCELTKEVEGEYPTLTLRNNNLKRYSSLFFIDQHVQRYIELKSALNNEDHMQINPIIPTDLLNDYETRLDYFRSKNLDLDYDRIMRCELNQLNANVLSKIFD